MTFRSLRRAAHTHTASEYLFGVFAVFCLLLILRNTAVAVDFMSRGLLLCARTVIPSLFPFMILSDLIVSGGFAERPLKALCAPLRHFLRLPTAGCVAVVLGLLCGFPVGCRCAVAAYERGEIDRRACERVLACASPPSSAFVIGAVGVSLWGNRVLGIVLYLTMILMALLVGGLMARKEPPVTERPTAPPSHRAGASLFTAAVRSSTESMLIICAYVVFFSALTGTLGHALSSLGCTETLRAVLTALFEMSSGVSALSALSNRSLAAAFTAATLAWSGLSVHCQLLSICQGHALSLRTYFISKLLQSLLCALTVWGLLYLFPSLLPVSVPLGSIYLL